jgi:hypothetical protein
VRVNSAQQGYTRRLTLLNLNRHKHRCGQNHRCHEAACANASGQGGTAGVGHCERMSVPCARCSRRAGRTCVARDPGFGGAPRVAQGGHVCCRVADLHVVPGGKRAVCRD